MGLDFDIDGLDKLQEGIKQLAQTGVDELNKGLDRLNGKEPAEKKSAVPSECPYCGAKLDIETENPVVVCAYCGAKFDNSSERTIVDSVFDFVEKQQKIAMEEKSKKEEREKIKAEEKKAKRKKRLFRNFVFLVIIVVFLMYYYVNYMM